MPRLKSIDPVRPSGPRLTRLLWQWLILGLLLCAALPAARSYNAWIGWLWYWLIATPALALAVAHRVPLRGAWQRTVQGWRARNRRAPPPAQARRFVTRPRRQHVARAA